MNTLLRSFTKLTLGCLWVLIIISISYAQYERPTTPRIRGLDWSPNGATLAVAIETPTCQGYGAQLLNANTMVVEKTLFDPYSCGSLTVDFNSDGTSLIIAEGFRIAQWNLLNYELRGTIEGSIGLKIAYWKQNSMQFIASGLSHVSLTTILPQPAVSPNHDIKSIGPIEPLKYSAIWNPQGNVVAIGTEGVIYLWNPTIDVEISRFTAPDTQPIRQLAWHPTQNVLASADDAGRIILWNTTNGQIISQYLGHVGGFRDLEWRPDGQQLASVGQDDTVRVWNYPTGSMQIIASGQKMWAVAYNPTSNRLVYGGEFVEGGALNIQSVPVMVAPLTPTPIACTHNVPAANTSSLISAIVSANSASTASTICLDGLSQLVNSQTEPMGIWEIEWSPDYPLPINQILATLTVWHFITNNLNI